MNKDFLLDDAMDQVTAKTLKSMTYGDTVYLNDMFVLYHYCEDETIVITSEDDGDEECVCLYDGDKVIFEML